MNGSKIVSLMPIWLSSQGLILPLYSDLRPLRGLTGVVDWYLDGRITDLIREGHSTGKRGERVLISIPRLVSIPRIVVLGVGPYQKKSSMADIDYYRQAGRLLKSLGIKDAAVVALEPEQPADPQACLRYLLDEIPPAIKEDKKFKLLLVVSGEEK